MDLGRLGRKAKDMIDKRGGTDALKEDVGELKDIAKGEGSLSDKAKAAGAAIKDPGAPGGPGAGRQGGERGAGSAGGERGESGGAGERATTRDSGAPRGGGESGS